MRIARDTAAAVLLVIALAPMAARADRFSRGEALFKQTCVSCHTLGWGSPPRFELKKVDLTGITARTDGTALRRFLAEPAKERPRTACVHPGLSRDAVDDLVRFFEVHSRPPPAAQVTPPRSALRQPGDPRRPPPVRSAPRGGQ